MKISEVLGRIREFTDYIRELNGDEATYGGQARTRWDYILSVYGPAPVLWVRGSMSYIYCPLQAVTLGWEGCDALPAIRPREAEIIAALELSQRNYELLDRAVHLLEPWNKQLRADLIEACGMENEQTCNWFKDKYEAEYLSKRRRG